MSLKTQSNLKGIATLPSEIICYIFWLHVVNGPLFLVALQLSLRSSPILFTVAFSNALCLDLHCFARGHVLILLDSHHHKLQANSEHFWTDSLNQLSQIARRLHARWGHPQNRKYITHCTHVRGEPSHGQRVQEIWWNLIYASRQADTQTR